jgi:hypothetical protein
MRGRKSNIKIAHNSFYFLNWLGGVGIEDVGLVVFVVIGCDL